MVVVGAAASLPARAATVPFTEEFAADSAGWYDAPGAGPLSWSATGGPDGSSFAFTTFNFVNNAEDDSVVLFRGQDEFGASGGALEGEWIAEGVTEFTAYVRHDADAALTFFTRFAGAANFPGAVAVNFAPVPAGTWSLLSFAIDPANPQFVSFEGMDFDTVFGSIGHVQIGVRTPGSLAGLDESFTFDLDKPTIVPEPSALALLAGGALGSLVLSRRGVRRSSTRRRTPR